MEHGYMNYKVMFIYSSLNINYTNVSIFTKYKVILPRLHNKKWTKTKIYSCRACNGPEIKYILLKHEYHNKHSNTNIQ